MKYSRIKCPICGNSNLFLRYYYKTRKQRINRIKYQTSKEKYKNCQPRRYNSFPTCCWKCEAISKGGYD